MSSLQDFVNRFHNLQGITIGEKQQSLGFYVSDLKRALKNKSEVDTFISLIVPKTHLEHLFKIQLLKQFDCHEQMFEVFKSENVIFIKIILKDDAFIDNLLNKYSPEQFINEFIPTVSYSTRLKLFNKLKGYKAIDCNDKLFDVCSARYGLNTAQSLLMICSHDKVKSELTTKKFKLRVEVWLKLVQRNVEFFNVYIEEYEKHFGTIYNFKTYYKSVYKYVVSKHPKVFFDFIKKRPVYFEIGRKTTRSVVNVMRNELLNNPSRFLKILNDRELKKCLLQDDLKQFYNNYLKTLSDTPQPFGEFDRLNRFMNRLPKEKQVELYLSSFRDVYNTSLIDNAKLINVKFLHAIEDATEREYYLGLKMKKEMPDDFWLQFYNVDKAIELLKQRLNLTTDYDKRSRLIELLVDTCYVNNDKEKFLSVCKYVTTRHRNDDYMVRMDFLSKINELGGALSAENLDAEHWNCIQEFIIVADLKNEYCAAKKALLEKHLLWHFLNNLPTKPTLLDLLKENKYVDFNLFKKWPDYERSCLYGFYEILPEVFTVHDELLAADLRLFMAVKNWNLRHPEAEIDVNTFARLLDSIKSICNKTFARYERKSFCNNKLLFDSCIEALVYLICKQKRSDFIECYWKSYDWRFDDKIVVYFLRYDPNEIYKNVETFTKSDVLGILTNKVGLNFCKKYSHLGLPDMIISKSVGVLEVERTKRGAESNKIKRAALRVMSYLMAGSDFIRTVKPYYSERSSCHSIIVNFKYVTPASLVLPEIINFCTKKHIQSTSKSLYCIACNISECELKSFIENMTTPVWSVQKHAISLTRIVLPVRDLYVILKNCIEKEMDAVAFKRLHQIAFQLFKQCATDELWDLFKTCSNKLDKNDAESMEKLININGIPTNYTALYVEFAWNIIVGSKFKNRKFDLLNLINSKVLVLLSNDFCCRIVEEHFFTCEYVLNDFVLMFLFHFPTDDLYSTRLNLFFKIINKQKALVSDDIKKEVGFRKNINRFMTAYYKYAISHPNYGYVKTFADKWNQSFKPYEFFDVYLSLQIIQVHLDCLQRNYGEFNLKLSELLHGVVLHYGTAIIGSVVSVLKDILPICFEQISGDENVDDMQFDFYKEFLKNSPSPANVLVVLKMIEFEPVNPSIKKKYCSIISDLKKRPEKVVRVYLNNHFRAVA